MPCQRNIPAKGYRVHTLLISALLSTRSATASGCFFNGDDIILPESSLHACRESTPFW
jgi:hypothetical protein